MPILNKVAMANQPDVLQYLMPDQYYLSGVTPKSIGYQTIQYGPPAWRDMIEIKALKRGYFTRSALYPLSKKRFYDKR